MRRSNCIFVGPSQLLDRPLKKEQSAEIPVQDLRRFVHY